VGLWRFVVRNFVVGRSFVAGGYVVGWVLQQRVCCKGVGGCRSGVLCVPVQVYTVAGTVASDIRPLVSDPWSAPVGSPVLPASAELSTFLSLTSCQKPVSTNNAKQVSELPLSNSVSNAH